MREAFKAAITETMKHKNISVKQLAQETGISAPYIYNLLGDNSKKRWNEDSIDAIAQYLGITVKFETV